MSRLVLPAGSSSRSSTLRYLACLRTDRLNSARAHSALDWLSTIKRSRGGNGMRGGKLEMAEGDIQRGHCSEQPAEAHPVDHTREAPPGAEHRGRDCQSYRNPAQEIDRG